MSSLTKSNMSNSTSEMTKDGVVRVIRKILHISLKNQEKGKRMKYSRLISKIHSVHYEIQCNLKPEIVAVEEIKELAVGSEIRLVKVLSKALKGKLKPKNSWYIAFGHLHKAR